IGGGVYAIAHKQAVPVEYPILLGLVWLAGLVTFGVRSNIAALVAGCVFVCSGTFISRVLEGHGISVQVPPLLCGRGAVFLAMNPEGTVHQWAMGLQRLLYRSTHRRPGAAPSEPPPSIVSTSDPLAEVGGS